MIVGIGVDLVDIARFERAVERTPRLLDRMFGPAEQALPLRSLAARYAAREALIKALGGSDGLQFKDVEITSDAAGRPWFALTGRTADFVAERGITALHLTLSHDAGLAIAYVIAEAADGAAPVAPSPPRHRTHDETPRDDVGFVADAVSRADGGGAGGSADPGAGAGAGHGAGASGNAPESVA